MGQVTQTTAEVQVALDGAHASIYTDDNAVTQGIPTGAAYTKVDAFDTNGNSSNCTADAANDKLTITQVGTYHVTVSCSFTSGSGGDNWFGAVFSDGVEQNNMHFERKIGTGGDYGSATVSGLLNIASVPTDIDFRVRHDDTGTETLTVRYCNLMAHLVGQ